MIKDEKAVALVKMLNIALPKVLRITHSHLGEAV
jgi:hypothetical protein